MQTFLPYRDFKESARVLDMRRLGRQRIEVLSILQNLTGEKVGWSHHPAVHMWIDYSQALVEYGIAICNEWVKRGYKDVCRYRIAGHKNMRIPLRYPKWLGDERLHSSHRAALLAKKFEWYSQFGWKEEPCIEYFWPTKNLQ